MNSTTNTSIHAHNEQASAHRQEGTPMNTNDLYALFDNMPHPRQVTPDTYGGYMCEPSPENHCVMLLDIDYGAMGGASLYVSEPGVLDTRIEFTADSPAMSAANLNEWLACFDRMRADLRNAYVWASTLLSTAGREQAINTTTPGRTLRAASPNPITNRYRAAHAPHWAQHTN